jgi:hypothetical protein
MKKAGGWGAEVIDRRSDDLGKALPDLRGSVPGNRIAVFSFGFSSDTKKEDRQRISEIAPRNPVQCNSDLLAKAGESWIHPSDGKR